jgi:hypothetical protein
MKNVGRSVNDRSTLPFDETEDISEYNKAGTYL